MPPVSRNQQKAAGMAVAMKEGKMPMKGKGPAVKMAKSMNMKQAKEFATAPGGTAKLPPKVSKASSAGRGFMKPKGGGRTISE